MAIEIVIGDVCRIQGVHQYPTWNMKHIKVTAVGGGLIIGDILEDGFENGNGQSLPIRTSLNFTPNQLVPIR